MLGEIPSKVCLPLVTLVGGFGLALLVDVIRDRRVTNRETNARRLAFQRETLSELQEGVHDLVRSYRLRSAAHPVVIFCQVPARVGRHEHAVVGDVAQTVSGPCG